MVCGTNKLVNWGQVGVGQTTLQDNAFVMTKKTEGCNSPVNPTPHDDNRLPSTGPTAAIIATVASIAGISGLGYIIASRKSLR